MANHKAAFGTLERTWKLIKREMTPDELDDVCQIRTALLNAQENDKAVRELAEALDQCEYALGRSVCWKPPTSNQREIEVTALDNAKQTLADHAETIKRCTEEP